MKHPVEECRVTPQARLAKTHRKILKNSFEIAWTEFLNKLKLIYLSLGTDLVICGIKILTADH